MNKQTLMVIFVLALAWGLPAVASDIYKRVNQDGVVEFSDRPSPDATQIQVRDEKVGSGPAREWERRPQPAPAEKNSAPANRNAGTGVDTAVATRTTSRTRGAAISNMSRSTARTSRSVSEQAQRQSRSTGTTGRSTSRNEIPSNTANDRRFSGTRGSSNRRAPAADGSRGRDANRAAPVQEFETDNDPGRAIRNAVRAGGG